MMEIIFIILVYIYVGNELGKNIVYDEYRILWSILWGIMIIPLFFLQIVEFTRDFKNG